MAKSKDLIKKHAEGVTHNTIGNIITYTLLYGGGGMMSWLVAHAAFIAGLPLYVVLILGVLIFLAIALAANFIDFIRLCLQNTVCL